MLECTCRNADNLTLYFRFFIQHPSITIGTILSMITTGSINMPKKDIT